MRRQSISLRTVHSKLGSFASFCPRIAQRTIRLNSSFQSPSRRCWRTRSIGTATSSADGEEAGVGSLSRKVLRRPARAPYCPRKVLVVLHEVPVHDAGHAVHANAVDAEVEHPTREAGEHETSRRN